MTELAYSDVSLHRTVKYICDVLTEQIGASRPPVKTEADMRYELVACLLGSQVRAESADAALRRLANAGLLSDDRWRLREIAFESDAAAALANQLPSGSDKSSYRFPQMRARQLSQMRAVLQSAPLVARLAANLDVKRLRANLVRELPGIGPKQASMFLRNVGMSYDVAILDVHVLRFFQRLGLLPKQKFGVPNLKRYEDAEAVVTRYAVRCGHRVGYLDWAIWITMRAATELRA